MAAAWTDRLEMETQLVNVRTRMTWVYKNKELRGRRVGEEGGRRRRERRREMKTKIKKLTEFDPMDNKTFDATPAECDHIWGTHSLFLRLLHVY